MASTPSGPSVYRPAGTINRQPGKHYRIDLGWLSRMKGMPEVDGVLRVDARSGRGTTQLVFTEQSICFTEAGSSGMEDVPDMLGMMLGTLLDSRKGAREKLPSSEASTPLERKKESRSPDGAPGPRTIEVPYTSIVRSYLARPGRLRRAKLAFDSYDQRRGKVTSREFLLCPGDAARVERLLSSLIPDRLEVH